MTTSLGDSVQTPTSPRSPSEGMTASPRALAPSRKPAALAWTSILLSGALLVASLGFVDARHVLAQLSGADMRWLLLAFVLGLIQLAILGLRWSIISKQLGVPLSWRRASTEYALSVVVNQVLPTGVAGEGLRAVRHARRAEGHGILKVVEVLALDRASGQLSLWLIVLAGAPLTVQTGLLQWQPIAIGAAGFVGVLLLVSLVASRVARFRRVAESARAVCARAARVLLSPRRAVGHLSLSVAFTAVTLFQLYVAARAIGVSLDIAHLFWLGPLIIVAASLPSFFGGWGIREGASALLFAAAGMEASTGVAVSVVYGAFALLASLPGVIVLLFDSERRPADPVTHWAHGHALSMLVGTVLAVWLDYPPLLAFVTSLSLLILIAQCRGRWTPTGGFGAANTVTTVRHLMTIAILAGHESQSGGMLAGVALLSLALDALDGWLARRSGASSIFGARYDVEVDSLLVITLAILLHARGIAGPWVLVAGLWHYVYLFAPVVLPTPVGEAPRSRSGRFVYVLMISSFVVGLVVPSYWGGVLAAIGTIAVSVSFLRSFWQRYQPAAEAAPAQ